MSREIRGLHKSIETVRQGNCSSSNNKKFGGRKMFPVSKQKEFNLIIEGNTSNIYNTIQIVIQYQKILCLPFFKLISQIQLHLQYDLDNFTTVCNKKLLQTTKLSNDIHLRNEEKLQSEI